MMKTRKEYEDICDKTFILAGEAQATRIQIDLFLEIRDLLIKISNSSLYKDIVEARKEVSRRSGVENPITIINRTRGGAR